MLIRVCDLCGKPITIEDCGKNWEVRQMVRTSNGSGKMVTLDVHDACVEKIINAEKFNQLWEEAECDSDSTTD